MAVAADYLKQAAIRTGSPKLDKSWLVNVSWYSSWFELQPWKVHQHESVLPCTTSKPSLWFSFYPLQGRLGRVLGDKIINAWSDIFIQDFLGEINVLSECYVFSKGDLSTKLCSFTYGHVGLNSLFHIIKLMFKDCC